MEKEKFLNFNQAKIIVEKLAKSQGFYCRKLVEMEEMEKEEIKAFEEDLIEYKVKNDMDLIFYFEC